MQSAAALSSGSYMGGEVVGEDRGTGDRLDDFIGDCARGKRRIAEFECVGGGFAAVSLIRRVGRRACVYAPGTYAKGAESSESSAVAGCYLWSGKQLRFDFEEVEAE